NGARLSLQGMTEGNGRVRLGVLHVRDGGKTLIFDPERAAPAGAASLAAQHLNTAGTVVDFGPVRTNGSVNIRRDGRDWVLQTFPRDRAFSVELSSARFGRPATVQAPGGTVATVSPAANGAYWRLPLNGAR